MTVAFCYFTRWSKSTVLSVRSVTSRQSPSLFLSNQKSMSSMGKKKVKNSTSKRDSGPTLRNCARTE